MQLSKNANIIVENGKVVKWPFWVKMSDIVSDCISLTGGDNSFIKHQLKNKSKWVAIIQIFVFQVVTSTDFSELRVHTCQTLRGKEFGWVLPLVSVLKLMRVT